MEAVPMTDLTTSTLASAVGWDKVFHNCLEQGSTRTTAGAFRPRFRTLRLEDGEVVVPLGRKRHGGAEWPSYRPHAGRWSGAESYALLQAGSHAGRRARIVHKFDPC